MSAIGGPMLAESLVYARSYWPTPPAFRPYLADAVGLWARGRRQASAWSPHLERTRAVIETSAERLSSRRTVAVLGAGPLFDVPIEALARSFGAVVLIDLVHLATTRRRLAAHRNVTRIWRDLAPVGDSRPLQFLADMPGLDWVISVNLVSQIGRAAPEGEERAAIDAHLDGLHTLPMPVTLIADVGYRITGRDGRTLDRHDLMHGRVLPEPASRWDWEVAPFGEESPRTRRVHRVHAYPEWHAAQG